MKIVHAYVVLGDDGEVVSFATGSDDAGWQLMCCSRDAFGRPKKSPPFASMRDAFRHDILPSHHEDLDEALAETKVSE